MVVFDSTYKAILVTNARAKANEAIKVLEILKITSMFYSSDNSNLGTLKGQELQNYVMLQWSIGLMQVHTSKKKAHTRGNN